MPKELSGPITGISFIAGLISGLASGAPRPPTARAAAASARTPPGPSATPSPALGQRHLALKRRAMQRGHAHLIVADVRQHGVGVADARERPPAAPSRSAAGGASRYLSSECRPKHANSRSDANATIALTLSPSKESTSIDFAT